VVFSFFVEIERKHACVFLDLKYFSQAFPKAFPTRFPNRFPSVSLTFPTLFPEHVCCIVGNIEGNEILARSQPNLLHWSKKRRKDHNPNSSETLKVLNSF